jgi:hypothetical protein
MSELRSTGPDHSTSDYYGSSSSKAELQHKIEALLHADTANSVPKPLDTAAAKNPRRARSQQQAEPEPVKVSSIRDSRHRQKATLTRVLVFILLSLVLLSGICLAVWVSSNAEDSPKSRVQRTDAGGSQLGMTCSIFGMPAFNPKYADLASLGGTQPF